MSVGECWEKKPERIKKLLDKEIECRLFTIQSYRAREKAVHVEI